MLMAPATHGAAQSAPVSPVPGHRYHFKAEPDLGPVKFGADVLSAEERAFLASLPTIRVGLALPPFEPYETVGADDEVAGIHVEILRQLARAFGFRIEPVVYANFGELLEAAKLQQVDVLMSMGVSAARSEYLNFTLGATPMVSAMFRRSAGKPTPEPDAARFAIERPNIANDFVRRRFPEARILGVDLRTQALEAVVAGEADYYIGNLLPTLDELSRHPMPGIQVDQLVDYGTGYYHYAVRRDWPLLAQVLNKGISAQGQVVPQALDQALAALPQPMLPQPRKKLSEAQWQVLLEHPVWRVGAVRGLTALNDVDDAGRQQGIAAEYVEWIARHLGVGVQVVAFDSVAAMLDAARRGEIDVVPFITHTRQRADLLRFSQPYVELPYVIVGRRNGPMYWDLASLHGKVLALAQQHPLREWLVREHPDIRVLEVPSGQGAMDAVAQGAADAAVEVKLYANLRIQSDGSDALRVLGEVSELPARFHMATSLSAQALLPLIDESLAAVPASERQRMLRRWIAVDLQPVFNWRRYAPLIGVSAAALLVLLVAGAWWMIRLRQEVRSRRESEEQLEAIGAALPCVAYRSVLDARGHLVSTYRSAGSEQVLGRALDPARSVIDGLAEYVREQDLKATLQARDDCLIRGEHLRLTVQYSHPDGRPRWLYSEAVSKRLGDGPAARTAMTGYIADITADFELQAKVARDAQARHLLLASASHELRAPTHTLSLALQAMADGTGDLRAHLGVAREATRTLGELITDVLDTARLDQGELRLRAQATNVRTLLERAAAVIRPWATDKGLQFSLRIDDGIPEQAWIDAIRLQQVLTNLLSNAVKYSSRGEVVLQAGAQRDGTDAPWLRVTVSDGGPGISAERLQRLFTPFSAAEGQAPVAQGSSGLGLSICKRLVDLMGGTIELRSAPGEGTQATVCVPLPPVASIDSDAAPAPLVAVPRKPSAVPDGTPVLVCDDDGTSRLLLTMMLQTRGYRVEAVDNATAALQRWRSGGISAVITDMSMPGMHGSELVTHIRRAEGGERRTRIVVCSGDAVDPDIDAALAPDASLVKPVDLSLLLRTLRELGIGP